MEAGVAAAEDDGTPPHPARTQAPQGHEVRVDRLTFSYSAEAEPVLRDLTLTLPYGTHLAIVGPSGVGKSTLANVLTGIAEPQRGAVSIGRVPLPDVDPEWLRRTVAIIPQEAYVFAGYAMPPVASAVPLSEPLL
jgi:ATP-binding cassette, subfamily C, bacterial